MPAPSSFDYAVLRLVPRVEREEFLNAGVILYCHARDFLEASVQLSESRVLALCPEVDLDVARKHLASIPKICRGGAEGGPLGRLTMKERFHWLVAPRSTVIQASPVHSGLCDDPAEALRRLMAQMVEPVGKGQ